MGTSAERWRFSVKDYHRMLEVGILCDGDPVELLDGELFTMAAMGGRHAAAGRRLNHRFHTAIGERGIVSDQSPVQLSDYSEPEPDVALLHPRADNYQSDHPRPDDVFLIVEIADSTIGRDRHQKIPLYAAAGIPEVWIANIIDDCFEVYRDPTDGAYRTTFRVQRGETVAPLAFPDIVIDIAAILGEP